MMLKDLNTIPVYEYLLSFHMNGDNPKMINSPFRQETKPSFAIYQEGRWYDFGSSEGGDIISLLEKMKGYSFIEARDYVYSVLNVSIPEKKKKPGQTKILPSEHNEYLQNFIQGKPEFIFERWKKRKINLDYLKKKKIGTKAQNGKYQGGFIIPFRYENNIIVKAKEIYWYDGEKKQRWISKDNTGSVLMGKADSIFQNNTDIILCEGEEDYWTLVSNGYAAVTGTAGAGVFKQDWGKYLLNKNVVIIYDNDEPGQIGARKAGDVLTNYAKDVRVANWIDKHTGFDIGDLFANDQENELPEMIVQAKKHIVENKIIATVKHNKKESLKENLAELFYIETKEKTFKLLQRTVAEYIKDNYKVAATDQGNNTRFFMYKDGCWEKVSNHVINQIIDSLLFHDYTDTTLRSIRNILASMTYIEPSRFDNYPNLINLKNCIFDLNTYQPIPHSADYYFTYKNEYNYDPMADCPQFHNALATYSLNDSDWVNLLWQIIGYTLTGTYDIQKMFWFTGSQGGNGKGTVTRVMQKLVGLALTKPNFAPEKLGENFYKKSLIGKRLAIAGDLPAFMSNVATIKELTGGDRQSTDVKFGDAIDFENTAKLVFAMNKMPVFSSNEAIAPILRRICLLPFDFTISEYKPELERAFESELPGIFNHAIMGLITLRANKEFPGLKRSAAVLEVWQGSVNPFNDFIKSKCVFEKGSEVWMSKVWDAYVEFMTDNVGPHWRTTKHNITTKTKFTQKLYNLDFKNEVFGKYIYDTDVQATQLKYFNIRLKTISDELDGTNKIIHVDSVEVF